jgi:hypothetical protein
LVLASASDPGIGTTVPSICPLEDTAITMTFDVTTAAEQAHEQ